MASYSAGYTGHSDVKYSDFSPTIHSVTAAPAITYAKSYDLGHADFSPASKFGGVITSSGVGYSKNYIVPAVVKPIIAAEPAYKFSAPAYIAPPVTKAYLPPHQPVIATPAPSYVSAPVTPVYEAPAISKSYFEQKAFAVPAVTKTYVQPGKSVNQIYRLDSKTNYKFT